MIRIRPMTDTDADPASELEALVFRMPWKSKDFMEMIHSTYAHYFVAEEDGRIVGICGMRNVSGEGEISNVAVHPDFRRQGIARKLLEAALLKCAELGITDTTLEVRVSNEAAIRLYESFGFVSEGVRPHFYENPDEDALILWRRS